MAGRLAGKTALITGGASGIGAAAARRFVEEGAQVLLADIQTDKGETLARELGCGFISLDVTAEADWSAAAEEATRRLGGLTTLFHSAGISEPANIETETLEHFRRVMAINTEAAFLAARTGVALMKGGAGGSIILTASTMGARGGDFLVAYAASKWGVRGITRATALHCARSGYNIRCNAILPGAIHTEMVERYVAAGEAQGATREQVLGGFASQHPMNRLGQPREAADAVVFLASDESSFITGVDLPVDGGFLA